MLLLLALFYAVGLEINPTFTGAMLRSNPTDKVNLFNHGGMPRRATDRANLFNHGGMPSRTTDRANLFNQSGTLSRTRAGS
jgi:hypothetical protein